MDYLLNTAPCGFLSFSSDGTITTVNATLAEWLWSAPEQLQNQSIKSILSIGGRVFFETHFWPQLELQGQIEEVYFSLRAKNGETVPVLVNAARHEREEIVAYNCIVLRMRQRDQYEREIVLAKKEAERANRAKADFLSMISHEFRTPLNAISGFTQLIAAGLDGPVTAAQQEDLKHIQGGSDHLLRLINDILNFAHMEKERVEVSLESVEIQSAIARAEALMKPKLQEAGLRFNFERKETGVWVQADPDRLQQILLNLLTNAIKFTPAGGSIGVAFCPSNDQVLLEVRDTGRGIAESQIQHIFEPFIQIDRLQTESSQRGIGLGLTICRELARAMGGDLTVRSTLGEGSIFTLALPRAETVAH